MFLGTYRPKLDDKGRLVLPAKFRDQLADGLVITAWQERSLSVYPRAEFEQLQQRLAAAPLSNPEARAYQRMVASSASEEVPDKQGRISISQLLRNYAQLKKDVVVIGNMDHVEIWEPAAWDAYQAEQQEKYSNLSDELFPGF